MKISNLITPIVLMTVLSYSPVFADDPNYQPEPDWKAQNAALEAQKAKTEKDQAEADAIRANTAATTQTVVGAQVVPTTTAVVQSANSAILIATPVPAPKETVTAPAGYVSCATVKEGWYNNLWVPSHRVCKYNKFKEGAAWVDGYWACTVYKATGNTTGTCTTWDWKPGHWVKTYTPY
jgi:hypothetical protein